MVPIVLGTILDGIPESIVIGKDYQRATEESQSVKSNILRIRENAEVAMVKLRFPRARYQACYHISDNPCPFFGQSDLFLRWGSIKVSVIELQVYFRFIIPEVSEHHSQLFCYGSNIRFFPDISGLLIKTAFRNFRWIDLNRTFIV
ncbi:MAG: hypothetical protein PHD61_01545 [Bacteroidales bacterium]|nr:hypothetical protein [Lentimicrobiaceae bacterium]MDD5693976.1 hypothetical protein [Bacteroidales bacterium]